MDYPMINGLRYSFASIEAMIDGKRVLGFTSISYKQSLEPGEARGEHAQRYGLTRGQLKADGSLEMLKEEAEELISELGDGYMEKTFPIVVAYAEDGNETHTDVLHGCRIQEVSDEASEGSDALKVKMPLSINWIEKNGKKPLKKMLSAVR